MVLLRVVCEGAVVDKQQVLMRKVLEQAIYFDTLVLVGPSGLEKMVKLLLVKRGKSKIETLSFSGELYFLYLKAAMWS